MAQKIEYVCKDADGNEDKGTCDSTSEMLDIFEAFLDNHGSGVDDFDEFTCKFVEK